MGPIYWRLGARALGNQGNFLKFSCTTASKVFCYWVSTKRETLGVHPEQAPPHTWTEGLVLGAFGSRSEMEACVLACPWRDASGAAVFSVGGVRGAVVLAVRQGVGQVNEGVRLPLAVPRL